MMRSLWTAATGMVAQQLNIDVLSNNLANVNTSGFKKSRAEFEDLMYQTMKIAGSATDGDNTIPVGIQVGMGVRPTAVHKFFSQGDFQNTGNALDIAIEGEGFFQVEVGDQLMYTRAGAFKLNQDGTIVTANGYVLQPEFAVPAETKSCPYPKPGASPPWTPTATKSRERICPCTPSSTRQGWMRAAATSMCRAKPPATPRKACPARTTWALWLRASLKCPTWKWWTKWSP